MVGFAKASALYDNSRTCIFVHKVGIRRQGKQFGESAVLSMSLAHYHMGNSAKKANPSLTDCNLAPTKHSIYHSTMST